MRTIKVKFPFTNENQKQRRQTLIEIAQSLSKNENLAIIEEKHFENYSYIKVLATKINELVELN